MGSFTRIEEHLKLAQEEINQAFKLIERIRIMFKNTPQEEINDLRHKLNELEKKF